MKITAVTCTFQRPEAYKLCLEYLGRQTRQPDQHLVLDGPDRMQKKVLDAIDQGLIEGDLVAFIEDDDWYRPDYLAYVEEQALRGYDMIGEGNAGYYNVASRWWSECGNVRHAALCATAVVKEILPEIANVIRSYDWPFFDTRIWPLDVNKKLSLPKTYKDRRVVGIKGIRNSYGEPGYSGEHKEVHPQGTHRDPAMLKLFQWIGDDALNYSKFRLR